MSTSHRVRADVDAESYGNYLIKQVGKRFRVYQDGSDYSSTSGGYSALGKAMRDCDNRFVAFDTIKDAERWIDGGCIVWPEITFQQESA